MRENELLVKLRDGQELTMRDQILLIVRLSIPAIMANISQLLMEYIDSSMVGRLGKEGSAAIGIVAPTTWLGGGMLIAASYGFSVQVAQYIGAKDDKRARDLVHEGLIVGLIWSVLLAAAGISISSRLPVMLGGRQEIVTDANLYFGIFALSAPAVLILHISAAFIQASGNIILPSILHVIMCILDVVFNFFLIFESRIVSVGKLSFEAFGFGLGVKGAAIGTLLAELCVGSFLFAYLMLKSPALKKRRGEKCSWRKNDLIKAAKIGIPVCIEQIVQQGAQILIIAIVAPLGTAAVAANSLAITAEGLCYMPGFGIGAAASTLIGQSIGAGRKDLIRRLSRLTTIFGMLVMAFSGLLLYLFAPFMMGILTPDPEVWALGVSVLRIAAFSEPFFAASIVANGCFRGAGDTFIPSLMSLFSIWAVRIPIAAILKPVVGLRGVWIAMAIELTFRGIIFIVRLFGKRWIQLEKTGVSMKI